MGVLETRLTALPPHHTVTSLRKGKQHDSYPLFLPNLIRFERPNLLTFISRLYNVLCLPLSLSALLSATKAASCLNRAAGQGKVCAECHYNLRHYCDGRCFWYAPPTSTSTTNYPPTHHNKPPPLHDFSAPCLSYSPLRLYFLLLLQSTRKHAHNMLS